MTELEVKVISGLGGLVDEYAVRQGLQRLPPEVIEEIITSGGKREAWFEGEISVAEIYALAAKLLESRATRH